MLSFKYLQKLKSNVRQNACFQRSCLRDFQVKYFANIEYNSMASTSTIFTRKFAFYTKL